MHDGNHLVNTTIGLKVEQDIRDSNTIQSEDLAAQSVRTTSEREAEAITSLNPLITPGLSSNQEIIQELVLALKRQFCKRSNWIMFLALLPTIASIVCFTMLSRTHGKAAFVTCFTVAAAFALGACTLFVCALAMRFSHGRRPETVARGLIRYVMRIEGDQWRRFITYFYSVVGRPSGVRGWWFSYQKGRHRYERLLQRNHGHIVIGSLGFMVDELFCTTYDRHVVLHVELLSMKPDTDNEPAADMVMRIWLCRRMYDSRSGPPTPFKVDIFLPSELPWYEIPGIVKSVAIRNVTV